MAKEQTLDISRLEGYEPVREQEADRLLAYYLDRSQKKIVVLDDDPTGVQTVHGVSVYTDWEEDSIRSGFLEESRLFFILTNSRGFTQEQTTICHRQIGARLELIAQETGIDYMVISRGDSTLRGHFPLETEILREEMERSGNRVIDGEVICPFFKEGGRFTLDNVHYVRYGAQLIPAGQTEFAKDRTFGYESSDLCEYVEEKTRGAYRKEDTICISVEDLRGLNLEKITNQLMGADHFRKIVVNAADAYDLVVFGAACYRAQEQGKHFLFRTAAAFVKAMGGISDQPLLERADMVTRESENGGIVVVGSHTKKTTAQLEALKGLAGPTFIEFNSDLVLDETRFEQEIERVLDLEEAAIRSGKTAVIYTRRQLLVMEQDTKEDALLRSVKISEAVQSLVGRLRVTPSFVIAKGGITSSDVGTKALKVKRAEVMGQIRPGIPVWKTGEESRFPGIPYVIFPGNVGEDETLREAVEILSFTPVTASVKRDET